MSTPDELHWLAQAERERRRRARLRDFPSYGQWLPRASPSFCWDYAWLRHLYGYYDRVTSGEIRKLMVFAPPQHGKSESGTVRYPVYRMERDPRTRVLVTAHTQRLANKFSRKSKAIARERIALAGDKKSVSEWETTAGGGITAIGVGGSPAGTPADLLFIDDPVKNREAANSLVIRDKVWDWYLDDITTRVQQAGATVLQMTRWHDDDLAGRILASDDGPNWTVVCLRALAEEDDPLGRAIGEALCPERFTRDVLLNKRLMMRLGFEALYQQRPTLKEGGLFKRAWFKVEERVPEDVKIVSRVRAWDLAATEGDGDWTVGVLIAKDATGRYWVEDVQRFQLGPHERDQRILKTAEDDAKAGRIGTRIHLEQEPGSAGKAQAHNLVKLLSGFVVTYEPSTGSKEVRAEPLASQFGADNVRLVKGRWNATFIAELVEFNNARHDDQVDGASAAFNKLNQKRQGKSL